MMKMSLSDQDAKGWEGLMQTGLNTAAGALGGIVPGAGNTSSDPGKVGNVSTLATAPAKKNLGGIVSNKYNAPWNSKK